MSSARKFITAGLAAFLSIVLSASPGRAQTESRDWLWKLIALKCLRHLSKAEAPIPCDRVDTTPGWEKGVAFMKDHTGPGQMLAVPTQEIAGIEDPGLQSDDAPNYFAMARNGRLNVAFHLRRPLRPEFVAMVVNARASRRYDQLHLRLDCLDVHVAAALRSSAGEITANWSLMKTPLQGRVYFARKLSPQEVTDVSPFRRVANEIDGARSDISAWSIAMVDAALVKEPGEILLAIPYDKDAGDAEALEDHACAIADEATP